MDTPSTEIYFADEVTSSIQAFGYKLHNTFQEAAKPRQKAVDDYQLPEKITDLKRERNRLRWDWQTTRNPFLKTEHNRKNHQVSSTIKKFSTSRLNTYIKSLSTADNMIW